MVPISAIAGSLFGTPVNWSSTPVAGGTAGLLPGGPLDTGSLNAMATNGSTAIPVIGSMTDLSTGAIDGQFSTSAPFAALLSEAVGQVDQLEKRAKVAVEGLITGKGVDIHEAMIATEKAEMGFELVLAVRNKALAAYQQVAGMQF